MKETSHCSSALEVAAVRIQYWFGKDKEMLLNLNRSLSKAQEFCKTYKCDPVKPPRIVFQANYLPLQGYALSKKKREMRIPEESHLKSLKITVDQKCCNINQKDSQYFQMHNTLSSGRVAPSHHKEHYLVSKRLKALAKQTVCGPKKHQVVSIKSSTKEELFKSPYLEEWGKFKEERQFQISRF